MNTASVAKLIHQHCGDYCNVDRLTGPSNASARAMIMSAIVGKPTPKSKSGINALNSACYAMFAIEQDCIALRCSNLAETVRRMVGIPC